VPPIEPAPPADPAPLPPLLPLLGGDPPLRWVPPTLVNPTTIMLGSGYTRTTLSPTRDYVIKLPDTVKTGGTWIIGGHNVVIVGGAIAISSDAPSDTSHRTAIYIKDATGTVHVEGVSIDASAGAAIDGIAISAPQATIQLENLRVTGLHGGFSGFHADVVQPWGGVGDLRIDRLTGSSDYQGLTLQQDLGAIGSAELSHVDLTAASPATIDGGGHMLWLTSGSSSCSAFPMTFASVYVKPRSGRTMPNSVWPQKNTPTACRENGADFGTWPDLPYTGGVNAGAPADGSYVPAGAAGLGYDSPGYAP
jgi:hypothetical protein